MGADPAVVAVGCEHVGFAEHQVGRPASSERRRIVAAKYAVASDISYVKMKGC